MKRFLGIVAFVFVFSASVHANIIHTPTVEVLRERAKAFPRLNLVCIEKVGFFNNYADRDIEHDELVKVLKNICYIKQLFQRELSLVMMMKKRIGKIFSHDREEETGEERTNEALSRAVEIFEASGRAIDFEKFEKKEFLTEGKVRSGSIGQPASLYVQIEWSLDVMALYAIFLELDHGLYQKIAQELFSDSVNGLGETNRLSQLFLPRKK